MESMSEREAHASHSYNVRRSVTRNECGLVGSRVQQIDLGRVYANRLMYLRHAPMTSSWAREQC